MLPARRTAVLVAALALAVPAKALAQGAGDDQYTDPLAGEDTGGGGSGGGGGGGSGSSGSGGGGGGGGGAEGSSGMGALSSSPPGEQAAAQTATPAGQLARTGADPGLVALLGAGFVLTGAGLRVRLRAPLA